MYSNLMGYKIYSGNKEDLTFKIENHLLGESGLDKLNIISGNPEVLLNGINNDELDKFFKREDNLIIPDGIGVVMMMKLFKRCAIEKISGIEVMEEILRILSKLGLGVYFLGATSENLELAIKNIKIMYGNLQIKGFRDGYFSNGEINEVVEDIKNSKSSVLFVAMGSPKQDIFISRCMKDLDCKIFMGVGGSFDLYSGKLKRAPKVMINFGLEWLYRVWNEPFRIKRLSSIPKFMLKSMNYHFKEKI